MRAIADFDEMKSLVGQELGVSDWIEVDQDRIDKFADATGDHQWIHVDVERAKKDMPGGKTIAHGYLTISLVPIMVANIFKLESVRQSLNYGSNRVRFTQPVPSGSRIRGCYRLKEATDVKNGGLRLIGEVKVEIEGAERPACIAELIAIHYQ
jgi:acyl dehydratase